MDDTHENRVVPLLEAVKLLGRAHRAECDLIKILGTVVAMADGTDRLIRGLTLESEIAREFFAALDNGD